jgi:tetratricopeptide (TPR) repeat protein
MRSRLILPVILILLPTTHQAFAQFTKTNAWVLYEQGNTFFSTREYGSALKKYQEAIAAFNPFPEAEMAIGDVYRQEGELDLAARQYRKAYELKNSFYILEMKYEDMYKLARVYEDQRGYKSFEDALKTILLDDKNYNQPSTSHLKEQVESNYYGKGLDFILKLYRFPEKFSVDAHATLGWYYYRSGNFTVSALHLIYSVVYKVSEASRYVLEKNTDFQFTTLGDFFHAIASDKIVVDYFEKSDIYKDLYYLAGSTFKAGYPAHARFIWQLLSKSALSGAYADLSTRQLKSPWIEPFLIQPPGQ